MAKIHNPQDQDGILLINQTVFDGEVAARTGAVTLLQSNIDNEVADRQAADSTLQSIIDAEKERAIITESTLSTVIVDEVSRAEEAEAALQSAINTEKDRAMTAELNLTDALSDEITRAQEVETTLQDAIDDEKGRAMDAELNLTDALSDEITRAQEVESALNDSLVAEVLRATEKENRISAIIDGEAQIFSTDKLTAGTYSSTLNKPSAINIHNSIFPTGIIKSIEIPDANISSARHLSVKVVDGLSDTIVDYTSSNTSTTKWNFDKFIKKNNISDNVYYKLVLSDAAGNSSNIYFGNISYNNGNFANCGFGGNWPNPDSNLTAENGATGLTRINIEFEPNLNDTIQNTKENIISIIDTLETKVDEHVEALDAVDASLLAKIDEEKDARISADENINTLVTDEISRATSAENELSATIEGIDERLLNIEGKDEFTSLEQQPTTTSQWTALEFKDNSHWVSNVSNKRITSISFKVANTVSTPHYLGVYDTRTAGSKILVATSRGTTWETNGNAIFKFSEPIIIPGKFELFLLNEPISGNHSSDLPAPDVFVESYTVEGTQNYRLPVGTWANSAKRAFYVTFNFVTDRLGTLENEVSSHTVDTVKHITAEERSNWNSKATIENINEIVSNSLQNIGQPYKFQRDKDVEPNWVDTTIAGNFTGGATQVELLPYTQSVESISLIVKYNDAEVYNSNGYVNGTDLPSKITIDGSNYISVSFAKHSDISFTGDLTLRFVGSAAVAESTRFILADVFGSSSELSFNKNSSYTAATFTIPQNATKVDVSNGSKTETYIVGQSKPSSHALYTVSGNTLTARAQGESGNSLTTTSYIPSNQPLNEVINVTLNDGQIITANVVSMNENIVVDSFNTGEKQITINTIINKPGESLVSHIIVDSICDSAAYDNAQHVCHVIPVRITL